MEKTHHRRSRPIRCIETGIEYMHCAYAAKTFGVPQCSIQKVCGYPNRTWKGLHFEYIDSPLDRNLLTGNHTGKVICVETGEIYRNAKDASIKNGLCPTQISVIIGLSNRTWRGLHFKYIKD